MKHLILIMLMCAFSLAASAQARGGQIKRKSASDLQHSTTSQSNSKSNRVIYPPRDEVFISDAVLPAKGQLNLSDVHYKLLPSPNFSGHILKRDYKRHQIVLKEISFKPNNITDDQVWFKEHGFKTNWESLGSNYEEYGLLGRVTTGGYHVLLFGIHNEPLKVIVTDQSEKILYVAYDFDNFRLSPKTKKDTSYPNQWVSEIEIEGNIMYVSHGGGGYSNEFGYQTGYISAINILTDEIIWTTPPMTNNSSKIAIVGNSIIAGYGFTAEPDFLYVIDKYCGQRVQKIPVKTAADYIYVKGQYAYVRTYDSDYIFEIK